MERRGVVDLDAELTEPIDTARRIAQLDGVIGVDSLPVHLAGALGKPVWALIGRSHHWRWLTTGAASPWYPTARVFRRGADEDWEKVVGRVTVALQGDANRAPL